VAARGVEPQKNQTEVVVAVHQQNAANIFFGIRATPMFILYYKNYSMLRNITSTSTTAAATA
jgi:hypothetical protein